MKKIVRKKDLQNLYFLQKPKKLEFIRVLGDFERVRGFLITSENINF